MRFFLRGIGSPLIVIRPSVVSAVALERGNGGFMILVLRPSPFVPSFPAVCVRAMRKGRRSPERGDSSQTTCHRNVSSSA